MLFHKVVTFPVVRGCWYNEIFEFVSCFQFGFLNYEVEDNKKLFFHMTEVHDNVELQPGDEVEFVVVQNQRNGKYSAVSLRKLM